MNSQLLAPWIRVRVSGWPLAVAAFGIAVATLLACYWPTLQSLVWVWAHSGTYRYAFLIFPLSLWVALDLRQHVRAVPPIPSVWGLLAVAMLVGLWYIGELLAVNLARHVAFVAMFPALVLACWGWRALRVLMFPLAYLVVFAVPWGNGLVGPLQDITAHFAVAALNLTGVPVLMNGREIITPSAVWMVEQACSGVKFFIACAALGSLFAYLMYRRTWKRCVFVALAVVVPIIANGLRVYFTLLIGEAFGLHYATGTDHLIFGWQFFGTVLVLLLLGGWFFRDRALPRQRLPEAGERAFGARAALWPAAFVLLIAGPAAAAGLAAGGVIPAQLQLRAPTLAGWIGPQAGGRGWHPQFKGAAAQFRATYRTAVGNTPVQLFHAAYLGRSRAGHSLIAFGNDVYDPANSRILATATRSIEFGNGTRVDARELRLTGAGGTRLVWYWYCIDRHCTASPAVARLLQAWEVVRGRVPHASVWAVSAAVAHGNADNARTHVSALARTLPVAAATAGARNLAGVAR